MPKALAPIVSRSSSANSELSQVWLRIKAFLSAKSDNTRRTYASIVNEWCEFLGAPVETAEAAKRILLASDIVASAYRSYLFEKPGQKPRGERSSINKSKNRLPTLEKRKATAQDGFQSTQSSATIAKKFAALRRIYRMLIAAELRAGSNPFDSDRVPAPSPHAGRKRPTEMVEFALVRKIVNMPGTKTAKGRRDCAMLAILFGGGLRRSEVVKLRIADVRRSQAGTLYLRLRSTKAKRDADQALPAWVGDYIHKTLEDRAEARAQPADYLFVSFRGRGGLNQTTHPVSSHGLYELFKKYCRLAGTSDFVSPHSARATAITKLLADGIPHREVQEFSRHSSVAMVEVYDKRRIGVDQSPAKKLDYD